MDLNGVLIVSNDVLEHTICKPVVGFVLKLIKIADQDSNRQIMKILRFCGLEEKL